MLPDKSAPNPAAHWLAFANEDLAYATMPLPESAGYNIACFHAQQAVEKALKAVLAFRGIEFERLHSIGYLQRLLPEKLGQPACLLDAVALTRFAVVSRYPGDYEPITEADYQEALRVATEVVTWVGTILTSTPGAGARSPDGPGAIPPNLI